MKWKRNLLLVFSFLLLGSATVLADSAYEWLRGKKVHVTINGSSMSETGYLFESSGKSYLPVREVSEHLEAIIDWDKDSNKIDLYKPNVHMAFNFKRKDGSLGTFGKVAHGSELNFFIFTQIDNLKVKVHSLKYEIEAPDGNVVYSYEEPLENQDQALMWSYSPDIKLRFDQSGEYSAKIYMNLEEQGDYFLVSQKILYSAVE